MTPDREHRRLARIEDAKALAFTLVALLVYAAAVVAIVITD